MADLGKFYGSSTLPVLTGGSGSSGGGKKGGSILGSILKTASKPLSLGLNILDTPRAVVSAAANEFDNMIRNPNQVFTAKSLKEDWGLITNHRSSILGVLDQNSVDAGGKPLLSGSGLGSRIAHTGLALGIDLAADPLSYLGVGVVDEAGRVRKLGTGIEEALNAGDKVSGVTKASLARKGMLRTLETNPELGKLTLTMGGVGIPGTENLAKILLTPTKLKQPILEALTFDSKASKIDRAAIEGIINAPTKLGKTGAPIIVDGAGVADAAGKEVLDLTARTKMVEKVLGPAATTGQRKARRALIERAVGGETDLVDSIIGMSHQGEDVVRQVGIGGKRPRIQEAARATLKAAEGGSPEDIALAGAKFDAALAGTHAKSLARSVAQRFTRHIDENLNAIGDEGVSVARDFGKNLPDGGASKLTGAFKEARDFEREVGLMTPSVAEVESARLDAEAVAKAVAAGAATPEQAAAAAGVVSRLEAARAGVKTEGWSKDAFMAKVGTDAWGTEHEIAWAASDAMRKSMREMNITDPAIIDSLLHGDITVAVKTDAAGLQLVAQDGEAMQAGGFFAHIQRHINGYGKAELDAGKFGGVARKADRVLSGRYSIVGEAVRSSFDDVARDLAARTMSSTGQPLEQALRKAGLYTDFTPLTEAGAGLTDARAKLSIIGKQGEKITADLEKATIERTAARRRLQDAILAERQFAAVDAKMGTEALKARRAGAEATTVLKTEAEFLDGGAVADAINNIQMPLNPPDLLDEALAAEAHGAMYDAAVKHADETARRSVEQAIAEAHFDKLKLAQQRNMEMTVTYEAGLKNAKMTASRALDDLPTKLRSEHRDVFNALKANTNLKQTVMDDAFWTERALGLIATEFTNHGAAGWLDKQTSKYVASLLFSEDNVGKIVNRISGITTYMRSAMLLSPAFHSRNMIGAAINNAFMGVRLKDYRAFTRMYYADESEWTQAFRDLVELMPSANRKFAEHQAAMGLNPTEYDRPSARLIQHLSDKFEKYSPAKMALSGRFSKPALESLQVETMARGALYMKLVEQQGMSTEAAWYMVGKVHVDYTDVSKLDVAIRKVVPFYMYMSRNLPLQLEMMARGGSLSSKVDQYRRNTTDTQLPPFAAGSYLNLGGGYSFNLGGLNPATDLLGSRAGDSGAQAPIGVLSQLRDGINPVLTNLWYLADGQKRGKGYGVDAYIGDLFPMYRSAQALVPTITPQNLPAVLRPATAKDRTSTPVNIASVILGGGPIRSFTR